MEIRQAKLNIFCWQLQQVKKATHFPPSQTQYPGIHVFGHFGGVIFRASFCMIIYEHKKHLQLILTMSADSCLFFPPTWPQ